VGLADAGMWQIHPLWRYLARWPNSIVSRPSCIHKSGGAIFTPMGRMDD